MVKKYKDIDFNFTAHPVTGDVAKKVGDNAVKQAVKTLILTNFFERRMNPDLGSNTTGLLFDNINPLTSITIENEIKDVLINYEPRIEVISVDVVAKPEQNLYEADIIFTIINIEEPVEINITLQRLR